MMITFGNIGWVMRLRLRSSWEHKVELLSGVCASLQNTWQQGLRISELSHTFFSCPWNAFTTPTRGTELHSCMGKLCHIGQISNCSQAMAPHLVASLDRALVAPMEEQERLVCWTSPRVRTLLWEHLTARHWWMSGDWSPPAIWQAGVTDGRVPSICVMSTGLQPETWQMTVVDLRNFNKGDGGLCRQSRPYRGIQNKAGDRAKYNRETQIIYKLQINKGKCTFTL